MVLSTAACLKHNGLVVFTAQRSFLGQWLPFLAPFDTAAVF